MTQLTYANANDITPAYVPEVAVAAAPDPGPDKVLVLWLGSKPLVIRGSEAQLSRLADRIGEAIDHPEHTPWGVTP